MDDMIWNEKSSERRGFHPGWKETCTIVLPIVGAGKLPMMVGWPSFTIQHLIFGMVLGLWPVLRPQDFSNLARQHVKSVA